MSVKSTADRYPYVKRVWLNPDDCEATFADYLEKVYP
jgi:hypothetical protein